MTESEIRLDEARHILQSMEDFAKVPPGFEEKYSVAIAFMRGWVQGNEEQVARERAERKERRRVIARLHGCSAGELGERGRRALATSGRES